MPTVRLHVVPLTDSELDAAGNPSRPYAIEPGEFDRLVTRVNRSFEGTGIRIAFDPGADWEPMADTILNTDAAGHRERGNQIASGFPGKVVCFLRWGPGPFPTGNGYAFPPPGAGPTPPNVDDVVQNYVGLPNRITPNFGLLNQGNGSFVAHELGHYLGLYHTFPGWTARRGPVYEQIPGEGTPSQAAADQAVIDYIGSLSGATDALDGDLLADTPPDPSPVLYQSHAQDICAQREITVLGVLDGQQRSFTFAPDPNNVMSYYASCGPPNAPPVPSRFSPQQADRMRRTLQQHPARRHLLGIAQAMWIHGTSLHAEFSPPGASLVRRGFNTRVEANNAENWLHFAIPSPVIASSERSRIDAVLLQFHAEDQAAVRSVHVYDGGNRIATFDGLNLSGTHPIERFEIGGLPEVFWGIGVSVRVTFGIDAGRGIEFSGAGADFV